MHIEEDEIPELIRKGHNREVLPVLYKTVFPKVKNYILKNNGRAEDAYDVFQDAVLLFYKQVIDHSFNEKYTSFGYVYRLSLNRWINKLKKDKKLTFTDTFQEMHLLEEVSPEAFNPLEKLYNNNNLLVDLFSNIGEKCIEILSYTIYSNLMIEDIMLRTGLNSEGAVKMKIRRCKEKLIKEVKKNPGLKSRLLGYE